MKIGIFYDHPKNYKGGFNYIVNLINCLTFQNKIITIILFLTLIIFMNLKKFRNKNVKIIKLSLLDRKHLLFYLHKFLEKFLNSFLLFDHFINKYKIELISHSYYYGKKPSFIGYQIFNFYIFQKIFLGNKKSI